ncbi:MAG: 2-amino-4-hydroxy-6-hydroxymethyldihydropteridine diphosphokinase [Brachymonas sp.]|nr:2-amino-4-hydroxy-6-hydroxymethyldihydropteridine diphosphokinase [Brachymonas sp.]
MSSPESNTLPAKEAVFAYIALGANLGNPVHNIRQARTLIAALPQTQIVASSSLYRSAPVDSSGPDYINAVLKLSTALPAYTLLVKLQNLEQSAGRRRPFPNAPRTLDLDILLYGDAQISSERLTVPHPRMMQRAFVLRPLHEIAPEQVSDAQLAAVQDQAITQLGA